MRTCRINEWVRTHFAVFDVDGYTKLTGQDGACFPSLWLDGAPSAQPVAIGEIGVSGEYYATFMPNVVGMWHIEVLDPTNTIWQEDFEAREADIDLLWEYESGRWEIDTVANTMTFYERDGVTVIQVYDLLDANGNPPTWPLLTAPFERRL